MVQKLYNQFLCSSFVLPEHRESIKRHEERVIQSEELHMPEIDEQQTELWERLVIESKALNKELVFTYLTAQGRNISTGTVLNIKNSSLFLKNNVTGIVKRIEFNRITGIEEK